MKNKTEKQYIYIVQAENSNVCKIGITDNLERRLKDYNNMTGKSKSVVYQYLFTCEVNDMAAVEKDIKEKFKDDRESKSKEIYFYNQNKFENYVNFIKSHKSFVKEVIVEIEPQKQIITEIKYVPKTTPTLKERGITAKDLMQKAKAVKNDEFYTRYVDIEKEISSYDENIWKDKVVFCNCDDAIDETNEKKSSAFAWFFYKNFEKLELKKLICTHFSGKVNLFDAGKDAYIAYISVTTDGKNLHREYPKNYSGSFDDPLSLKILREEADIVCTNPPFSRTIDFWKIVIASGKKFLIISNKSNVINTAYIPYFKNNLVWAGYNRVDWYENPRRQLTDASGFWFTNLPVKDREKAKNLKIVPLKEIPEQFKLYDDSNTLIMKKSYIPSDYKKPFAVSNHSILNGILEKGYKIVQEKQFISYINGKKEFSRVLIQKI